MRRGGDWSWTLRNALAAFPGPVCLVTITAPGADVLPYGPDGQYVDDLALSEWCSTMMARWHLLRDSSAKSAKRSMDSDSVPVVLAYVWQLQTRRAPHLHVVVSAAPLGRTFAVALKTRASDYGFGFVDIKTVTGSALAVGVYLSRYLTRDLESSGEASRYLPARPAYVSRKLCRRAGVGIAVARKLRHLWVFANRDSSIGVPAFASDWQESAVYYWYRVGRRGRENVSRPLIFDV
jgi:hypothetical protein